MAGRQIDIAADSRVRKRAKAEHVFPTYGANTGLISRGRCSLPSVELTRGHRALALPFATDREQGRERARVQMRNTKLASRVAPDAGRTMAVGWAIARSCSRPCSSRPPPPPSPSPPPHSPPLPFSLSFALRARDTAVHDQENGVQAPPPDPRLVVLVLGRLLVLHPVHALPRAPRVHLDGAHVPPRVGQDAAVRGRAAGAAHAGRRGLRPGPPREGLVSPLGFHHPEDPWDGELWPRAPR